MEKIRLVCVGKCREPFWRDAVQEFEKRLSRYARLQIDEVEDEKTPEGASAAAEEQIREKEGRRILARIPDQARVIALAIDGRSYSSEQFAARMEEYFSRADAELVFVIGGSLGLSRAVYDRADERLSFSSMTFPHQLMRVIFLEQLYRSYRIRRSEPYHK